MVYSHWLGPEPGQGPGPGPVLCRMFHITQESGPESGPENHIFTARVRTYDGRLCFHRCVSVQGGWGGTRSQIFGGVPGLRFSGGEGLPGLRFSGRVPGLRFSGGGGTWSQ